MILFLEIFQRPKAGLYSGLIIILVFGRGGRRTLSKNLRNIIKEMRKNRGLQKEERLKGAAKKSERKRMNSQEFLEIYDKLWKEGPTVKYQNPEGWVDPRPDSEK